MNYDKIILELMSRVKDLEDDMTYLKTQLDEIPTEPEEEDDDGITRAQARDIAIKELQARFPDYVIQKAQRKDGGGILMHTPRQKTPVRIKFYHSKMHPGGKGWHVVHYAEIVDLDYCIFSLLGEDGGWNYFIYGTDEIGKYMQENRADSNAEKLHLYFSVSNGKASESRETEVDVTANLNNWDVLSEAQIKR